MLAICVAAMPGAAMPRRRGRHCLLLSVPCPPPAPRGGGQPWMVPIPSLGARLGGRPSLGLNKKITSHNTHKILMCLQNYLIFYLEVIPPLSSFIALYMTEVGEQRRRRPARRWSGGSVYGPALARQPGPGSPFIPAPHSPPAPPPACSIRGLLLPTRLLVILSFQTWVLLCFSVQGGGLPRSMTVEWAAGAPGQRWGGRSRAKAPAQHFQPRSLFSELRVLDI